jgi:hypothetical protein
MITVLIAGKPFPRVTIATLILLIIISGIQISGTLILMCFINNKKIPALPKLRSILPIILIQKDRLALIPNLELVVLGERKYK